MFNVGINNFIAAGESIFNLTRFAITHPLQIVTAALFTNTLPSIKDTQKALDNAIPLDHSKTSYTISSNQCGLGPSPLDIYSSFYNPITFNNKLFYTQEKFCNPTSTPDDYSECEMEDLCDRYWSETPLTIVPEGMSPVNALRALEIYKSPFGGAMLDKPEPGLLRDKYAVNSRNQEMVERAFERTVLGFGHPRRDCCYVDYYDGSLIKTEFHSFPLLNARGYDREYGEGVAQLAIDIYHANINIKLDVDDKTLQKVDSWKPPRMHCECLTYDRVPSPVKQLLNQHWSEEDWTSAKENTRSCWR